VPGFFFAPGGSHRAAGMALLEDRRHRPTPLHPWPQTGPVLLYLPVFCAR
jgi:hypothetical protein